MTPRPVVTVIENPISGTRRVQGLDNLVADKLVTAGFDVCYRRTCAPGDAVGLAREAVNGGHYAVVAIGGDGTINEVANALVDTGMPMGIIPCGSGNGLARHLEISMEPEKALDVIIEGRKVLIDYAVVNDSQRFFCTFGIGFDAEVTHRFSQQSRRGKMMYVKCVFDEFVKYKPTEYTISCNGEIITEKAFLVAVCNASQYGNNAYIAPDASVTDGLLDVTVVHAGNPLQTAVVGVDLLTGFINRNILIQNFKTPEVAISRTSAGNAHLDGEPVSLPEDIFIKCRPRGLALFVPSYSRDFVPIVTPIRSMITDLVTDLNKLVKNR